MRRLALALALVACSSDPPITPDTSTSSGTGAAPAVGGAGGTGAAPASAGWESGDRLAVRRFVGSDGSAQPASLHDTELEVDCSPLPHSDGGTRCLPSTTWHSADLYADAACTQRAVIGQCGAPSMVQWVLDPVLDTCSTTYRVYRRGAAVTQVYAIDGGTNQCAPALIPLGMVAAVRGDLVPGESFVAMTLE